MVLPKSDSISLGRRDLWRHSLYTALCTHVICKWLHPKEARVVDAEEAFTAGLLHDMGKMGIEISMPNEYAAAAEAAHNAGVRFHEIERDFLPYAHAVVGSAMADNWSLPDSLCDIILNHHTPMDSQISPQTTAIVTLADEISQGLHDRTDDKEDCQEHASSETFEQDPAEPVASEAATVLRLNDDAVQNINDACRLEMNKGIALSSF
jgi:putative nucleotidyltransferase with HDIG domain